MAQNPIFGLCVLDFYNTSAINAIIDLGVKWVRVTFTRASIEPSAGTYSWNDYDNFVIAMQAHGVHILAQVTETPPWITWTDWTNQYSDITTFFSVLVNRYKPRGVAATQLGWNDYGIRHWEIFNEENYPGHGWMNSGDDATAAVGNYAQVLSNAAAAIRTADPKAVVVLGGLSPDGVDVISYTNSLYSAGAAPNFDIYAYHPYGFTTNLHLIPPQVFALEHSNGDSVKPFWFSEFGTNDTTQQISLLQNAWNQREVVDATFWFCLTDIDTSTQQFGLLTTTYAQKPVYSVFKGLMAQQAVSRYRLSSATRALRVAKHATAMGGAAYLMLYTGLPPISPDVTVASNRLLAACPCSSTPGSVSYFVVDASPNVGGTGGTDGEAIVTGTTGTGTKFTADVVITGGAIVTVMGIATSGSYTVQPTSLVSEPVVATTAGAGLTGATLSLAMSATWTANAITATNATGTGTVGWGRFAINNTAGAAGILDIDVGASGTTGIVPTTTITAGNLVNVSTCAFSEP